MPLPVAVRRDIETYLSAVDRALPGFVEGLYVNGSIPLGDYRPTISDVDLVAVCAGTPTEPQLDALAAIHRPSHPSIDVLYLPPKTLGSDPPELSRPIRSRAYSCRTVASCQPGDVETTANRGLSQFGGRRSPRGTSGSTPSACAA